MNWHVEVIRFECISHLPKCTQGIISERLLEAKCLMRFVAFLWVWLKKKEELCSRQTCFKHSHRSQESTCSPIIRLCSWSSPGPDTWGTSSLLWARRSEEGSGRRCGSCRHSRHTATGGLLLPRCHTPDTRPDPPGGQAGVMTTVKGSFKHRGQLTQDFLLYRSFFYLHRVSTHIKCFTRMKTFKKPQKAMFSCIWIKSRWDWRLFHLHI